MVIDKFQAPSSPVRAPRGFLHGRVALITGGARRIGRALTLALASEGASVVVHYWQSEKDARHTADAAAGFGVNSEVVKGDLAGKNVAKNLVAQAAEIMDQPVDILINNASVFDQGSLQSTNAQEWDLNQAVNVRAPFLLGQAMARQADADFEQGADIINLNDARALQPGATHFAYTNSKAALHGLTRSMALALAPAIRVNELALGSVLPPETAPENYTHTLREEIPLQSFGAVSHVASAMLFLLENKMITGQTICVDGGLHLR